MTKMTTVIVDDPYALDIIEETKESAAGIFHMGQADIKSPNFLVYAVKYKIEHLRQGDNKLLTHELRCVLGCLMWKPGILIIVHDDES